MECNCRNQSGLCTFCSTKLYEQLMAAPSKVVRLKVLLATKKVSASVRNVWKRELAEAERLAA